MKKLVTCNCNFLLNYFDVAGMAMRKVFFLAGKAAKLVKNTFKSPIIYALLHIFKKVGQTGVFAGPILAPGPYV